MLVKELMEILQECDPESEVILQRDAEGNGYSPACSCYKGYYIPQNSYSGDVYDEDWTADYCDMEEDQWEEMRKNNPISLILFPID